VQSDGKLPEPLEILAVATGNSQGEPAGKFSTPSFSLLPEASLNRNPQDAIADLLQDLAAQFTIENIW
jgi:hypothetical protein